VCILCECWLRYFISGVNFRRSCWFSGLFFYFIVNFVLIFAEISVQHVKVYCVNWNLFEII